MPERTRTNAFTEFSPQTWRVLTTCEHAGNSVPASFAKCFQGRMRVLSTHRAFDPGASELADAFQSLSDDSIRSNVTRLLIELNRSPGHPRWFSEYTRQLTERERQQLVTRHYQPFRQFVVDWIERHVEQADGVLHLSLHTFTPVLRGIRRKADIGLLYDPQRDLERHFARAWQQSLRNLRPDLVVRRNYPYQGRADGHTTSLRRRFPATHYIGLELEVNQKWPRRSGKAWQTMQTDLVQSFQQTVLSVLS